MTVEELLAKARRDLTRDEQMQLAHELWILVEGPDEDPTKVEAAWATGIGERLKGIVDGTEVGVSHAEACRRFGLPLGDQ